MPTDQIESNKQVARRLIEELFGNGNTDVIDELIADDFVSPTWHISENGRAMLKAAAERVAQALSDPDFQIQEMLAERDLVAVRLTASATQTGEFMGMPPSGKRYTIGEMHFFRVRDGRIVEHWHQYDALGMMQQLGLNG